MPFVDITCVKTVFRNRIGYISGRQPIKNYSGITCLKQNITLQIYDWLSSTNFTWFILNPFPANVPIMEKAGCWFLLA